MEAYIKPKSVTNYLSTKKFNSKPKLCAEEKDLAVAINHLSLNEQTKEFADSLVRSIKPFVFSEEKLVEIERRLLNEEGVPKDEVDQYIVQQAKGLFRKDNIEGQLGELILYVILEQYYRAVPIIRKMPITTNPNLERNGADAIHLRKIDGTYEVIIGEAKTYEIGDKQKNPSHAGFVAGIKSALESYANLWKETDVYMMADYIPNSIKDVVTKIRKREIQHKIQICCICVFEHKHPMTQSDIDNLNKMHAEAESAARAILSSAEYQRIRADLKPVFNFISFPVVDLKLLKKRVSCLL